MRLTKKEIKIIKETIHQYFDENLKIFLFGSRIYDDKKGGDIDLYLLVNNKINLTYKKLITKIKLEEKLNKPIDLVISNKRKHLIDVEALQGVELK